MAKDPNARVLLRPGRVWLRRVVAAVAALATLALEWGQWAAATANPPWLTGLQPVEAFVVTGAAALVTVVTAGLAMRGAALELAERSTRGGLDLR